MIDFLLYLLTFFVGGVAGALWYDYKLWKRGRDRARQEYEEYIADDEKFFVEKLAPDIYALYDGNNNFVTQKTSLVDIFKFVVEQQIPIVAVLARGTELVEEAKLILPELEKVLETYLSTNPSQK